MGGCPLVVLRQMSDTKYAQCGTCIAWRISYEKGEIYKEGSIIIPRVLNCRATLQIIKLDYDHERGRLVRSFYPDE